jgi:TIR domain-containing protein
MKAAKGSVKSRRQPANNMKIFLGWSGSRSKALANIVGAFVEALVPGTTIFFSPSDIDKGSKWRGAVAQELQDSDVGLWCLTRRSLKSTWVPFEAGAISKAATPGRVCPLLFGISSTKLPSPLSDFHATEFAKSDVWRLIKDLLELVKPEPKPDIEKLHNLFDRLWGGLEKEVMSILETPSDDDSPIEKVQGQWWSKVQVGAAVGAIGYVTISSDPTTEAPYLAGRSYEKNGIVVAEWRSKGACIIAREGELVFFYYWEGSHRNENPVFVGSGEIRFPQTAGGIETGDNFFTDTILAEIPTSVIKKGRFRRATSQEQAVMALDDGRRVELIQRKLAEPW